MCTFSMEKKKYSAKPNVFTVTQSLNLEVSTASSLSCFLRDLSLNIYILASL